MHVMNTEHSIMHTAVEVAWARGGKMSEQEPSRSVAESLRQATQLLLRAAERLDPQSPTPDLRMRPLIDLVQLFGRVSLR